MRYSRHPLPLPHLVNHRGHAPALALVVCLLLAGFGESLLAQPRRAVNPTKSARGVTLSELSTFNNRELVSYEIMPFGDEFYLATYDVDPVRRSTFNELYSLRLHRYDAELKRDDAIEVAWPDEAREHLSLTSVGSNFVWTFARFGRARDEVEIVAEILDGDGALVRSEPVMRVEARDYVRDRLEFESAFTPRRSHYVRVYAERSENRLFSKRDDERAAATVLVVDEAGDIVSNQRVRLNANRDQLNIEAVSVDDEGRAYVLAKVFANKRGRERALGGSDARLFLYTLEPGGEEVATTELRLQGQYIEGVSLVPNDAGAPSIVGLYSERLNNSRIAGYFSAADVRDGEVLKPQPFTQRVLEGMGRKITSGRKGNRAIERDFVFRDALRHANGRLSLLMESFDVRVFNDNLAGPGVGGFGRQRVEYVYGEGVILDFDEGGQLDDALVVPKLQTTDNPFLPYARMNLVEYEGRAAVLYNDNPKNFTRNVDRRTKPLGWNNALAVLGYAETTPSGRSERLRRVPLFARKQADKVIAMPPSVTRMPDGRIVFLASRYRMFGRNEVRFGVITP